jgi:hypothetical protein
MLPARWPTPSRPTGWPGSITVGYMATRKRSVNEDTGGPSLPRLIERSAELKRDLVAFAQSPRFERQLAAAILDGVEATDRDRTYSNVGREAFRPLCPGC